MGIEYIAAINEDHYQAFRMIVSTDLPSDYAMWLRVRERGKVRAFKERGTISTEIEVSPTEFGIFCKGLKRPDFSIVSLDRCAAAKATALADAVGRDTNSSDAPPIQPEPEDVFNALEDALVHDPGPSAFAPLTARKRRGFGAPWWRERE